MKIRTLKQQNLVVIVRLPGCEGATVEDVDEWMNQQTEVTNNEIVQLVNCDKN